MWRWLIPGMVIVLTLGVWVGPAEAARIFIKWENSTTPAAEVVRILGSEKDIVFTMTPNRVMDFVDVMHKVGLVKLKPQAWTDMFFDGLHKRPGS